MAGGRSSIGACTGASSAWKWVVHSSINTARTPPLWGPYLTGGSVGDAGDVGNDDGVGFVFNDV